MILSTFADTGRNEGNSWYNDIQLIGAFPYYLYHIRPSDNLLVSARIAMIEVP